VAKGSRPGELLWALRGSRGVVKCVLSRTSGKSRLRIYQEESAIVEQQFANERSARAHAAKLGARLLKRGWKRIA
jgi:hypothetical protein